MIFTEPRFLAFFAIVFGLYWMLRENRPRKLWLLLASYAFYAAWDWRFLSLIWLSTVDLDLRRGFLRIRAKRSGETGWQPKTRRNRYPPTVCPTRKAIRSPAP